MRLPYFSYIRKSFEWIETRVLLPASIITLCICGVGAGHLEALYGSKMPIQVIFADHTAPVPLVETSAQKVVASKNGTTFYYAWCTGRNRIKPENERWFDDSAEALKYGLKPAKNCYGL